MLEYVAANFHYWIYIILFCIGLYTVMVKNNLIKKIIGLNIFQTAVFLFYISMSKIQGGTAPILTGNSAVYDNPLPHVLILTAIVVGVSGTAVGLALVILINKAYGTIEEDEILELDRGNEQ